MAKSTNLAAQQVYSTSWEKDKKKEGRHDGGHCKQDRQGPEKGRAPKPQNPWGGVRWGGSVFYILYNY